MIREDAARDVGALLALDDDDRGIGRWASNSSP